MVLIGHSFGGFLAGFEGSRNLDLAGIAMISAVNLGTLNADPKERQIRLKRWSTQLHPVRGVTASDLFAEAARHATDWDYVRWTGALRGRALLIVTADDQNRTDMDAWRRRCGRPAPLRSSAQPWRPTTASPIAGSRCRRSSSRGWRASQRVKD